ncbi:MAG: hypothetical protein HC822_21230 [Oscillochloris sp.]|nr:hypothetical protein [Oscillochloris sp.]
MTATQELQTTVLEQAVLRVQPVRGEGSGRPGTRVAYAHRLSNDGNITVTVDLDYFTQDPANSPLWNDNTTISTDTVTIAPGDFRDIGVNVTVPETGQVGTQATTYISATVASYPDQTRYFSDTTTVALEVEAEMFPDETQPGEAGGEVIFYHTVRNLSNGPATYRLNTQANYDSTVTFESDTPGVTINPASNTFTLDNVFAPPLRTNTMRLKVTVRLDPLLLPGDQEVLNIFLTDAATNSSIGGAAVVDRVNITRGQIQPRLWFPMLFN